MTRYSKRATAERVSESADLTGKAALVTGANTGIGKETARVLALRGATVTMACRDLAKAESAREEILGGGDGIDPAALVIQELDMNSLAGVEQCAAELLTDDTPLDLLVNNAGIMREGTALETSADLWAETLAVNLTAPFLLIRSALPYLIETGGSIVNIGSIEGLGANPRHPAYCASKAGLHGLTRAIAVDHGPDGVRCNAVAPGWIDTDLNIEFVGSQPDPTGFQERLSTVHPVGRTGTPGEIASLVAWLGSSEAAFVTGQIWVVDGGRTAKLSLP